MDRLQKRLSSCKVLQTFVFECRFALELTRITRPFCSIEVGDVTPQPIPGACWRLPRWGRAAGNGLSHPRRICSGDVGAALCRYRGVCYVKGNHLDDASLQGMTRLIFHKYISPRRLTFQLICLLLKWGKENISLTQGVPWICGPQVGGGLVLGDPSLITRQLLRGNRKNIHQVHEGSLVTQTTENNNLSRFIPC